jgi:hypothetical protein
LYAAVIEEENELAEAKAADAISVAVFALSKDAVILELNY